MENLIYTLSLKGYNFEKIIIGHLKGFDLRKLGSTIRNTNLKTILCIHDFYLVCNTFDFLKNKKDYCGLTRPTKKKCLDCYNYKKIKTFYRDRDYFFKSIDKNLVRIVFPSDFCKNKWLEFFPKYKSKAVVRNNLITTDVYQKNIKNKKLRIAYIGKKNIHKGIKIWNEIESNKKIINNFDLYYFGINTDNGNKNIKNIYVNNTKNNPYMMRDKLREYNIDIVILWSIIPETYSFTCWMLYFNK